MNFLARSPIMSMRSRRVMKRPTNLVPQSTILIQLLNKCKSLKSKGSRYSITKCRVPELIPVLGSQPPGDASHKPGGRLPLLAVRPAVTLATLKRAATNFTACWTEAQQLWTVCLRLLHRQRRGCDLNPGPSAVESSTLTTRLSPLPPAAEYHQ